MNKSSNSSNKRKNKSPTPWKAANIIAVCYTVRQLQQLCVQPTAESKNKNLTKINALEVTD